MHSKRIALLLPSLVPFGGAERLALSQMHQLLKLDCQVDFVFVSERNDLGELLPDGVRVFDLAAKRLRDVVRPLARYLRAEQPDAIHVLLWPLTALAIVTHAMVRSKARIIVSDHNTLSAQYAFLGAARWIALRTSLAATYWRADARVAVSRGVAQDLSRLSGLASRRFTVIHNPMPLPDLAGDAEVAERAWGGWRGRRILTVGRLKRQKNQALLIESFAQLGVEAHLMILGEGDLRAELEGLVTRRGLQGKVLLPGQVENPEPYYRSADLFVLSSDYEGFGNVIVEALACGLPVVSTDYPSGPSEILGNGRWGRLTPVGDASALARGMEDALSAPHDPDISLKRAADFAPEISAKAYLELMLPNAAAHAVGRMS